MPRGRPPEPKTREQWQECVNLIHACYLIDSARQYGLITGGPKLNLRRAEYLLEKAKRKHGIDVQPEKIADLAGEVVMACHHSLAEDQETG